MADNKFRVFIVVVSLLAHALLQRQVVPCLFLSYPLLTPALPLSFTLPLHGSLSPSLPPSLPSPPGPPHLLPVYSSPISLSHFRLDVLYRWKVSSAPLIAYSSPPSPSYIPFLPLILLSLPASLSPPSASVHLTCPLPSPSSVTIFLTPSLLRLISPSL